MNTHNQLHFVGDLHGFIRHAAYWNEMHTSSVLFHVGDLGVGYWYPKESGIMPIEQQLLHLSTLFEERGNRFLSIRGNHDNPEWYDNTHIGQGVTLIKDNTTLNILGKTFFCVGGAISVDRHASTEGIDYWEQEVFGWDGSLPEAPIDAVVTHAGGGWTGMGYDTPFMQSMIRNEWMHGRDLVDALEEEKRQHDSLFEALLAANNSPKKWFYGHFHRHLYREIHGCEFLCLKAAHSDGRKPDVCNWQMEYVRLV